MPASALLTGCSSTASCSSLRHSFTRTVRASRWCDGQCRQAGGALCAAWLHACSCDRAVHSTAACIRRCVAVLVAWRSRRSTALRLFAPFIFLLMALVVNLALNANNSLQVRGEGREGMRLWTSSSSCAGILSNFCSRFRCLPAQAAVGSEAGMVTRKAPCFLVLCRSGSPLCLLRLGPPSRPSLHVVMTCTSRGAPVWTLCGALPMTQQQG